MDPHPLNVPGPFYVEGGCCAACMAAVDESRGLLRYDQGAQHCHVLRQPASSDELTHMVRAASVAELQCLRYRGADPKVRRRLAEAGLGNVVDNPPIDIRPVLRNTVRFRRLGSLKSTAIALRESFASGSYFEVSLSRRWRSFLLRVEWAERYSARIRLHRKHDHTQAVIVGSPTLGVQLKLDDAVASIGGTEVEWRSEGQAKSEPGTPWPV